MLALDATAMLGDLFILGNLPRFFGNNLLLGEPTGTGLDQDNGQQNKDCNRAGDTPPERILDPKRDAHWNGHDQSCPSPIIAFRHGSLWFLSNCSRDILELRDHDRAGRTEKLAVAWTGLVCTLELRFAFSNSRPAFEAEVDIALRTTVCVRVHAPATCGAFRGVPDAPVLPLAALVSHEKLLRMADTIGLPCGQ